MSPAEGPRPTRRRVLAYALGGATLAVAGGAWASRPENYLRALLARTLPGVTIEEAGFRLFAQELFTVRFQDPKHAVMAWGLSAAELGDQIAPTAMAQLRADFDRRALTFFLSGSSFFALDDPRAEPVIYGGAAAACQSNPFARFDDEA